MYKPYRIYYKRCKIAEVEGISTKWMRVGSLIRAVGFTFTVKSMDYRAAKYVRVVVRLEIKNNPPLMKQHVEMRDEYIKRW